ncbi:MAG: hypothetical protein QHH14_12435 [Clostridiales bacterium]|nr:hypothetical protein [Clostridiales bacterium]
MNQKVTFKHPLIVALTSMYLIALIGLVLKNTSLIPSTLPFSLGLFALLALAIVLTKGNEVVDFPLEKPSLGILVFILCCIGPFISKFWDVPEIGGEWKGTSLLIGLAFSVLIPLLFLRFKEEGFIKFSFCPKNLKKDLKIALVMGVMLIVPTFFFYPPTWKPVLSGEISITQVLAAFPVSLIYFFFLAALPEEFFFRAFFQEHCAQFLRSRISGLIVASLIFGYLLSRV